MMNLNQYEECSERQLFKYFRWLGGELFHNTHYPIKGFTLKNLKNTFLSKIKKILAISI